MTPAELLTQARAKSGMTVEAFAQQVLAGRAVSTVYRWLAGAYMPAPVQQVLRDYLTTPKE